jgi:hypothetical protein
MTDDAKTRVAEYQLACQKFKEAERDAEQVTMDVQAQAELLAGWRKLRLPCSGGVIAPPGIAVPAGEADPASVVTPAPIFDENKWPAAERVVQALRAFQEASEKLYQAWGALRHDERTGFVGPDDLTAQPSLAP